MRGMDPARRERERLLVLESRNQAREEAQAVAAGVAETVGLSRARGAAFEAPRGTRSERDKPYRRQPGLDWLARKGRLTAMQKAAGERYGAYYRRAKAEGSIPSTLDIKPRTSAPSGAPLTAVLAQAEARVQAVARLTLYRELLRQQADLVAACDLVCGEELTPQEAAKDDRGAGRIEAILTVALDILSAPAGG
jgi:hypothetical protein